MKKVVLRRRAKQKKFPQITPAIGSTVTSEMAKKGRDIQHRELIYQNN